MAGGFSFWTLAALADEPSAPPCVEEAAFFSRAPPLASQLPQTKWQCQPRPAPFRSGYTTVAARTAGDASSLCSVGGHGVSEAAKPTLCAYPGRVEALPVTPMSGAPANLQDATVFERAEQQPVDRFKSANDELQALLDDMLWPPLAAELSEASPSLSDREPPVSPTRPEFAAVMERGPLQTGKPSALAERGELHAWRPPECSVGGVESCSTSAASGSHVSTPWVPIRNGGDLVSPLRSPEGGSRPPCRAASPRRSASTQGPIRLSAAAPYLG
eukprot:TRINITY_DN44915_c0_g1_i1.p1 TRINITY_DN44915_c0_g1~~TRINITY_DN44915_c0_g1_i1.p1  ORF type:complete len:273 (-),score=35.06 TRINITY_DN44915_c0_g1_i1:141-959(-)